MGVLVEVGMDWPVDVSILVELEVLLVDELEAVSVKVVEVLVIGAVVTYKVDGELTVVSVKVVDVLIVSVAEKTLFVELACERCAAIRAVMSEYNSKL